MVGKTKACIVFIKTRTSLVARFTEQLWIGKKKQQKNGDKIFSKAVANRFMLTYTLIPKFFSAKTFSILVKYFGQIFNSKKMNFIDENKIGLSKLRI